MRVPVVVTFLSFIGFAIVYPALPFQAMALGADAQLVTVLLVIEPLAAALLGPMLGGLSDRAGRRPVTLLLLALAVPAYLLMALADSLWILFLSRALAGASTAVSPVIQAYLADVTSDDDRVAGMASVNAAYCLAFIVGPLIAAVSLGAEGTAYGTTALVAAASAVAATLLAARALSESLQYPSHDEASPKAHRPRRHGGRRVPFASLARAGCALPVAALVILALVYAGMDTTLGLWLDSTAGWGARALSIAFAIAGASAFVALCLIRRLTDPLGEAATAAGCALAMTAGFAFLLFGRDWVMLGLAMALLGAGMAIGTSCLQSLVSKAAPVESRGTVLGECDALVSIAGILGPLGAGSTIAHIGQATPYSAAAVLTLIATLLLIWLARAPSVRAVQGAKLEEG